jgi:Protein of unknown function (DUF2695)
MVESAAHAVESQPAELSRTLTEPGNRKCLRCYILLMLDQFGCDNTLRRAEHWRDLRAPRAIALARSLSRRGGFCDCEVILNVYRNHPASEQLPPYAGVSRRGSTRPCALGTPGASPGPVS